MTDERAKLLGLAMKLLEGASIDWEAAAAASSNEQEGALIRQMGQIASIAEAHRRVGVDTSTAPKPQARPHDPRHSPGLGTVGNYQLLEWAGEGSLGMVYKAKASGPDARIVALKLIKWELGLAQTIERLDRLKVKMARLPAASIARVLDTSVSSHGRVFVVSEWVDGVMITDHCRLEQLTVGERIELFVDICKVISEGHRAGILHRGIKPGNIPIQTGGKCPGIKVLDFGVAAAVQQRALEWTLLARYRRPIPAPSYISPDELLFSDAAIDARSDVYSLGILLFEMLTDHLPFEPQEPATLSARGLRRLVLADQDPPPEALGPYRQIVARALQRDREARFDSVSALADALIALRCNDPNQE